MFLKKKNVVSVIYSTYIFIAINRGSQFVTQQHWYTYMKFNLYFSFKIITIIICLCYILCDKYINFLINYVQLAYLTIIYTCGVLYQYLRGTVKVIYYFHLNNSQYFFFLIIFLVILQILHELNDKKINGREKETKKTACHSFNSKK